MTTDLFGAHIRPKRAIGGHHNATTGQDEWLTPPELIAALGPFDLDPCAPIVRPWPTAARHFTVEDDGLRQQWEGLTWLNPPYATVARWLAKLAAHGNGIALLHARTETRWFHDHIWAHATALLFLKGRLHFHYVDGKRAAANSGAPSVLAAYGDLAAQRLTTCRWPGQLVTPIRNQP